MADKKDFDLGGIFTPTEGKSKGTAPDQGSGLDLDAGHTIPIGVGLSEGTTSALEAIARELGLTKNRLAVYAIRRFIVDYRAGKLDIKADIQTEKKTTLNLPK